MPLKLLWVAAFLTGLLVGLVPTKIEYVAEPEAVVSHATTTPAVSKTFDSEVTRLAAKYKQSEILARTIIHCESRQYGSSGEHKNYTKAGEHWSTDWGWWQINDYYNEAPAARRGFDIYDKWENLEWGFIMLKEQGTSPWNASKGCWNA